MYTVKTLALTAFLFTIAAWFSLQGVSGGTFQWLPEPEPPKPAPVKTKQAITARKDPEPKKAAAEKLKPETAKKPKPASPFLRALQAGDLCEVSRILNGNYNGGSALQDAITALSPGPALQEAFAENGPMMSPHSKPEKAALHSSVKFLWALKAGELFYAPGGNGSPDTAYAKEMLLALEKENPGNGIYPFFRMVVEEKLGASSDELAKIATQIAESSYFGSEIDSLNAEIREGAWQSPAMHFALSNLYYGFNPNFYQVNALLTRLQSEGKFDNIQRVGELLVEKGQKATRPAEFGGYDTNQYTYGQNLLNPYQYTPPWNELEAEKHRNTSTYPPNPWTVDPVTKQKICDPGPYETYFYEARERM